MVFNLNATNNLSPSSTSSCTHYFFDGCHSKNQNNCQSQYQDCQCRPCCVNSMINDHTYSLLKKICRKVIRDYHRQQTREKYTIFDGGNSINVRIHRSSFVPGEDGKCKPIVGNQSFSRQNDDKGRYRKKDKGNSRNKNKGTHDDDDADDTGAKTNGGKRKGRKSDLNGYENSGVKGYKRKRGKGEYDINEGRGKGKDKGGDDDDSGKRKRIQVRGMREDDNGGSSKRGKGRKEKRKGDDQDDDSGVKQGKRKGSENNDDGKVKRAKGIRGKGITYDANDQDEDVGVSRNTRSKGENIENADNKRNVDKVGKVMSANNRKDDGDGNDDTLDFKVGNKKSEKGKRRSSEAYDDGKHEKGKLDKSGAKRLENGEGNDKKKSDKANRKNYEQGTTDLPVISNLRTKVRKGHDIIPNSKTLKGKANYQSSSFQEDGRKTKDSRGASFQISKLKQKQLSKRRKDHINERFGSRSSRQKFRSSRRMGRVYRGYGPWRPSRYDEIRPCDILRAHMEQRELCERQRCCLPCPCNCNTIYCQAPSTICSALY